MRALLCLHHRLDPDRGAPGATLALGAGLVRSGCEVEYLGFDHVFAAGAQEGAWRQLQFPWHVAAALLRRSRRFDVVDASTGDAWLWGSLDGRGVRRPGLITRAHGLEHVSHERERRVLEAEGGRMRWRHLVYVHGVRLPEVRRSLRVADHCVMLNSADRDYARDRLGIPANRLSVMPNGVREHFLAAPAAGPLEGPLRLCFLGSWSWRKGIHVLAGALANLEEAGLDYRLTLLGTLTEEGIREELPARARDRVELIAHYGNQELPQLLASQELLLFPSLAEGSSVALLEAMACGVAPIATRVGAAPDVVHPGRNGVLIEPGSPLALSSAVIELADDRGRLLELRQAAQATARDYGWDAVAARTVKLYERVLAARSTG